MSVLVKGMKMPRDCYECKVWSQCFDEKPPFNMIKSVCPLVEVKEPHGLLGDLDKLKAKFRHSERVCSECGAGHMIGHKYECDKAYHDTHHNFCPNCGADMREGE